MVVGHLHEVKVLENQQMLVQKRNVQVTVCRLPCSTLQCFPNSLTVKKKNNQSPTNDPSLSAANTLLLTLSQHLLLSPLFIPLHLHEFSYPSNTGGNFSSGQFCIICSFHQKCSSWASLVVQWLRINPLCKTRFDPWARKIPHAVEQLNPCATYSTPALKPESGSYWSPHA